MRSDSVKVGDAQAPHRSLFNALGMTEEELMAAANKWSVTHGGMSGRAAQQLIDSLQ